MTTSSKKHVTRQPDKIEIRRARASEIRASLHISETDEKRARRALSKVTAGKAPAQSVYR
jgi:hypothetical protein